MVLKKPLIPALDRPGISMGESNEFLRYANGFRFIAIILWLFEQLRLTFRDLRDFSTSVLNILAVGLTSTA